MNQVELDSDINVRADLYEQDLLHFKIMIVPN